MRSVDVSRARTFLQKKFLDRQLMMDKEQLIKLVSSDDLPRVDLSQPTVNRPTDDEGRSGRWFDISDTSVHEIGHKDVFEKKAYLLFYERLS